MTNNKNKIIGFLYQKSLIALVTLSYIVMMLIFLLIVPRFSEMYNETDLKIPLITGLLISTPSIVFLFFYAIIISILIGIELKVKDESTKIKIFVLGGILFIVNLIIILYFLYNPLYQFL